MTIFLSFFFFFSLSFSIQIQARDTNFFSKFSHQQTTKKTDNAISPAKSPSSSSSSSSVDVEHGYGLYGGENPRYPPMTVDPVKTGYGAGKGEPFVSMDELRGENVDKEINGYATEKQGTNTRVVDENRRNGKKNGYATEKQGMSDARFLENGKYFYDVGQDENMYKGNSYVAENQGVGKRVADENSYPENRRNGNKNGYATQKQGMSDTRFLENGRYYYDVNKDENMYNENSYVTENRGMGTRVQDENRYHENKNDYATEKQGMSDTSFLENGKYSYDVNQNENMYEGNGYVTENENTYPENRRNGNKNGYATQKQGMSDTRFLENGKYFYDVNQDENMYKGNSYVTENENRYPENRRNGNKDGYATEKQGMSDTRFLENGRYYHDVNREAENEKINPEDDQYFETEDNEFDNRYDNNNYENEHYGGNVDGEYTTHERRGYNYNGNGNAKKLPPNQYDTMEEYDKEEENRLSHKYEP